MDIKETVKTTVTEQVKEKGNKIADEALEKVSGGFKTPLEGLKEGAVDKAAHIAGDAVGDLAAKILK